MGNAPLRSHDDLVHVRGWTSEQIMSVAQAVRGKANLFRLTSDDFARYFGGRSREVLTVFSDLDTDCDGLVDALETLTVLAIWSGTCWDEKKDLLFQLFDITGKNALKIDELLLMGSIVVQVVSKFCMVDPELHKSSTIQRLVHGAIPQSDSQIGRDQFQSWADKCEPLMELRHSVEDHAARKQPETAATRKRLRIMTVEQHASKLFDRIERLQDVLPDFTDACIEYVGAWGRRKRWDFLMQNLRQLIWKLQQSSTNMHTTLADLDGSLNEEELSGGTASVVEPMKRFQQERMLLDLEAKRLESLVDYGEAADLLERLIELTEPTVQGSAFTMASADALAAIAEGAEGESALDMSPPRVVEHREIVRRLQAEMNVDTLEGGCFHRKVVQDVSTSQALAETGGADTSKPAPVPQQQRRDAGSLPAPAPAHQLQEPTSTAQRAAEHKASLEPVLTVIADFNPPPTHAAQMLKLQVGEQVKVMGQDGRGWWFGRKDNGREGWFPPSFVQLRPAHFSAPAAGLQAGPVGHAVEAAA